MCCFFRVSIAIVLMGVSLGCDARGDLSPAVTGSTERNRSSSHVGVVPSGGGQAGTASEAEVGSNESDLAFEAARRNDPALENARTNGSAAKVAPLRLLVIGAHPADVFDQSGGTMAHHVKRGDWVGCLVLTHGARVHDKVVSDEMFPRKEIPDAQEVKKTILERADLKTKEILRACSILGVRAENVFFLGADDAVLLVNEPMIRQMARLIRKLRPDVVVTHFPLENAGIASQHATTGQMVMHAVHFAAGIDPGDKTAPHKVTQVFFFGIGAAATRTDLWDSQGGFHNDVFIDITDVAAKKIACLDEVASQGYGGAYARKRIESIDGAFGSRVKAPYAEGFISLKSTTHYYLPVSKLDLEHSKSSDHKAISRSSYRVKAPVPQRVRKRRAEKSILE
ncbi:MAG: PIG-L family deacetylase [Pirellulales bacterium]|nr:PIG-L family deacetylase [Pirellulales bacterium]